MRRQPAKTRPSKLSSRRGQETRNRILRRSASIFNKRGYAGTSLSDLMSATGLEKGGIYRHFASKEELALAAFDYAWAEALRPRMHGLDACASATDRLLLMIRNFAEIVPNAISGGCPLMNTAIDSDDGNPLLRDKARRALHHWKDLIVSTVRQGQQSREFRQDISAEEVATVLISSLEGALMISRLERNGNALKIACEHLNNYVRRLGSPRWSLSD